MSLHNYVVYHNYIDLLLIVYKTSAAIISYEDCTFLRLACCYLRIFASDFAEETRQFWILGHLTSDVTDVVLKANCLALR